MAYDKSNEAERVAQRELMRERAAALADVKLPRIESLKRRNLCLSDPRRFLRTYFERFYFNPFTNGQKELIEIVEETAKYGTQRAIAYPRGDGKTKICEGMTIFSIAKGYIDFSVPVAAVDTFALKILNNIKTMLKSPMFCADFPEIGYLFKLIKDEQRRANSQTVNGISTEINWTNEYIQFPNVHGSPASGAIIYPLAITGAIRGLCIGERRPNHVLIDDPETYHSSRNEEQVAMRESVIDKDISGLKGPDSKLGIVALVTIQTNFSLAARLTDRKKRPDFGGVRRGLIETWPDKDGMDKWEEYFELRKACQEKGDMNAWDATLFYLANRSVMENGAKVNNPYRFNKTIGKNGNPIEVSALQACMNFVCDKGMDAFMAEYQNDPSGGDEETVVKILTSKDVESRTNGFERGQAPYDPIGTTCAIDVGKRYCHWTKITWLEASAGCIVDYGVIENKRVGAPTERESVEQSLLFSLLDFYEGYLSVMDPVPDWTLIDSSDGVLRDVVYNFVLQIGDYPPIAASKGVGDGRVDRENQPSEGQVDRIHGNHWYAQYQPAFGIWLYHPDAHYWKRWVQERFSIDPFDGQKQQKANTLTLPCPTKPREHQSFAKHIVAKEFREVFLPGKGIVKKFVQVNQNDHWLDSTYMASSAAAMRGFIDPIELQLPAIPQQSSPTRQSQFGVTHRR